jgi:hypothetical protein
MSRCEWISIEFNGEKGVAPGVFRLLPEGQRPSAHRRAKPIALGKSETFGTSYGKAEHIQLGFSFCLQYNLRDRVFGGV